MSPSEAKQSCLFKRSDPNSSLSDPDAPLQVPAPCWARCRRCSRPGRRRRTCRRPAGQWLPGAPLLRRCRRRGLDGRGRSRIIRQPASHFRLPLCACPSMLQGRLLVSAAQQLAARRSRRRLNSRLSAMQTQFRKMGRYFQGSNCRRRRPSARQAAVRGPRLSRDRCRVSSSTRVRWQRSILGPQQSLLDRL